MPPSISNSVTYPRKYLRLFLVTYKARKLSSIPRPRMMATMGRSRLPIGSKTGKKLGKKLKNWVKKLGTDGTLPNYLPCVVRVPIRVSSRSFVL